MREKNLAVLTDEQGVIVASTYVGYEELVTNTTGGSITVTILEWGKDLSYPV